MTYAELLAWVNDLVRTQTELQAACTGLGLATTGTVDQLRRRLRGRISTMPNLGASSPWTPPGWAAAPPAPVGPTPVPGPVPAPPTPPGPGPGPTAQTVPPALQITTPTNLPPATVGTMYNQSLTAIGGTLPYAWTLTGNPAWITLAGNTVSGTPTMAGTVSFTATVTDATGKRLVKAFTLQVNPATVPAPAPVPANTLPWLPWGAIALGILVALIALALFLPKPTGLGVSLFAGNSALTTDQVQGTVVALQTQTTAQNQTKATQAAQPTANVQAIVATVVASMPTQAPPPTAIPVPPTAVPTIAPTAMPAPTDHWSRLEQLDPVFRSQGLEAWLKAAGLIWDGSIVEARQPEEETSPQGRISVSGVQLNVRNLRVNWPNLVTTDVASRITTGTNTLQYRPDQRNGSTLYTNVVANGPVTVWVSGLSWGQFTSRLGGVSGVQPAAPTAAAAPTSTASGASGAIPLVCLSVSQLDATYGIVRDAQGARNGLLYDGSVLAGAVLRLTQAQADELTKSGWTIQGSNPSVKSAWSPPSCRPLK